MNAKQIMEDVARTRENFKVSTHRLWDYLDEKNQLRDPLDAPSLGAEGEILLELAHISARRELEARNLAETLIERLEDERSRTILRLRYMDGLSWELIRVFFEDIDQPICQRHIFRIHAKAMDDINAMLNELTP